MPTVRLMIGPRTNVRSVQGDKIYFRIPKDKLRPEGLKRRLRLEAYNQYKSDLFDLANDQDFSIPEEYHRVIFYITMPKSWKKWKYVANNHRPHQVRPDWDNLAKALYDALKKRDYVFHDVRITKIWTDHPTGYIEVVWGDDLKDWECQ